MSHLTFAPVLPPKRAQARQQPVEARSVIASAQYRHPVTGATAEIVIYPSLEGHVACTYLDGTLAPHWQERQLQASDARVWGNIWHLKLTKDYGMQRLAASQGTQQ